MRYLALDVGTRRIGVATGSDELRIASPLVVIERSQIERDAERIRSLVRQYEAERIIVGLPRELDGTIGDQAKQVIEYAERLQFLVGLPVQFHDERYSTAEALARRREAGVSEKRGRPTIDAAAAAVILQDFFEAQLPSGPTGEGD